MLFRLSNGEGGPSRVTYIVSFGISKVSQDIARVLIFERGTDGIWGPTQTLVRNNSIAVASVGISATAAVAYSANSGTLYFLLFWVTLLFSRSNKVNLLSLGLVEK